MANSLPWPFVDETVSAALYDQQMVDVDLRSLVGRLADRRPGRTEANVQSDLHMLLLAAPLELAEGDVTDIVLEQPTGDRRRIDVEVGLTVFEVNAISAPATS